MMKLEVSKGSSVITVPKLNGLIRFCDYFRTLFYIPTLDQGHTKGCGRTSVLTVGDVTDTIRDFIDWDENALVWVGSAVGF